MNARARATLLLLYGDFWCKEAIFNDFLGSFEYSMDQCDVQDLQRAIFNCRRADLSSSKSLDFPTSALRDEAF